MDQSPRKVALVTGASSGIGAATALRLRELGCVVYGAARRSDRLADLAAHGILPLTLDVTDEASMSEAVGRIVEEHARIDVLVNNAGYGSYGAIEDVPLEEGRHQFDVNVFGAVRMIQLVLPHMRAQRSGTIVNITSMGGKIYTPFGGWYHGTKFALEAISDCLRLETRPFGIDVVVVEPGSIDTEWSDIAAQQLESTSGDSAYAQQVDAMLAVLQDTSRRKSQPGVIADVVGKAVTTRRPRTRYAAGHGARLNITMRRLLPDRLFDRLVLRATGLGA
jgi:NAD(P)-dependent dehydrogenase (short-subunit alcohol dehydrogenase family)